MKAWDLRGTQASPFWISGLSLNIFQREHLFPLKGILMDECKKIHVAGFHWLCQGSSVGGATVDDARLGKGRPFNGVTSHFVDFVN